MRVTGKSVGDQLPDQGYRLGGGLLLLDCAVIGTASFPAAGLMSLMAQELSLLSLLSLLFEK